MPRMNISISDTLRERMDELENVNWSAVAQAAFELEIKSKIKGYGDMEMVIERLKASKQRIETEVKPLWIGYGAEFASNTAEFDELERISSIDADDISNDKTGSELLKAIIAARLEEPVGPGDRMEFLEVLTGDSDAKISRLKVEWILEGMMNVWDEVKDKI
jgi:hypothetical protein